MKKFLAIICFGFLSLNTANAEVLTLGISGNAGLLEASGKETITGTSEREVTFGNNNTSVQTAGVETTTSTKGQEDVYIGYVSLFGEAHLFDSGLRLGLSYVPYALESETTDNSRHDNCKNDGQANKNVTTTACVTTTQTVQIDVEDLVTMYVAYHHEVDLGFVDSVFIKGGIIEADVITKEKLSSGSKYGNTTLSGQMLGLGAEKNMDNGMFVRFEANMTEFDSIKLKNLETDVDANKNTIDITGLDGGMATLSIGKSF
jgi:hypothetical protein